MKTSINEYSASTPQSAVDNLRKYGTSDGVAFVVEHPECHPMRRFHAASLRHDQKHILEKAFDRIEDGIYILPIGW